MLIELIYSPDCPHVGAARTALDQALKAENLRFTWREWDQSRTDIPPHIKPFGSPTILINGLEVCDFKSHTQSNSYTNKSCRIYLNESGQLQGAPTIKQIRKFLQESNYQARPASGQQ